MLMPEYLDSLPESMVALFAQAEQDILADMARRINTYDYYIPAAQWQHEMLQEMGAVHKDITAALAKVSGRSTKELEQMLTEAGAEALRNDDAVYRAQGLTVPSFSASPRLQAVLRAGYKNSLGELLNITASTANTATHQFENACNRAWMQVTSGGFSYDAAVRSAIKRLTADGVGAVAYPSGRVESLEAAVRRAVVTGVNQTALRLQDERAAQFNCDLVEVTAHGGARPSHAEWQGKVFSRSGKNEQYPDFIKATGYGSGEGLGGWNCRHSFYPFFEGGQRAYTPEMLQQYDAKSIRYNGEMLTEYEASQKQRYIERQIRRWKREFTAMEAAGMDSAESAVKLRSWREAEKDFCKQTGLKQQAERTQVAGFGKSSAQKANQAAKKQIKDFAQQHLSSVSALSPLQNQQIGNTIEVEAKRFLDRAEADKLFRPWTEDLWLDFGLPEREALYEYTAGSEQFNRPLRGYDKSWDNFVGVGSVPLDNEGAGEMISDLASALDKAKIKEDVWLFRGSEQQSLAGMLGIDKSKIIPSNIEALNRKYSGTDIMDSAFFSTGISADAGFKNRVSYEILAPKGTKGLYVEPFSKYGYNETNHLDSAQYGPEWDGQYHPGGVGSEAEVILQRGTCFKIKAINEVAGKVNVILEIIG